MQRRSPTRKRERERESRLSSLLAILFGPSIGAGDSLAPVMMQEMGRKVPERSGEKSSFALTCNLLSQYMKEKGSLAGLSMAPPFAAVRGTRPATTMSLLPGADVSVDGGADDDASVTRSMELFPQSTGFGPAAADVRMQEKNQLTIFYGGKVLVFNNFPAEKARDLMQLASKGSAADHQDGPRSSTYAPASAKTPPQPASAKTPPQPSSTSYLPIARKASLHRFLEKRKDRINAKAPYQGNDPAIKVKVEESDQPWLGLAQQASKPGLTNDCSR